jgi:bifunctional non-homologous end joining protein LigD
LNHFTVSVATSALQFESYGGNSSATRHSARKTRLAQLLARRVDGIFLSDFEQGEIGPDLFRKACEFGLEGMVSKRLDRPYRGGRSPYWIKVKNRTHHAFDRVKLSHS